MNRYSIWYLEDGELKRVYEMRSEEYESNEEPQSIEEMKNPYLD